MGTSKNKHQQQLDLTKERGMPMALQEYKCPNCGGAIKFESNLQKMKCPFCEAEFDMGALKELDNDLKNEQPDDLTWETQAGTQWQEGEEASLRSYVCKSCAGEIVGDANTAATSCPYCGNPVVMTGQFSGALRPDFVLPFKLDKDAAKAGLLKHLKGKFFLPKVFTDQNHIDEIKGIYVPFWLFDADASGKARYKAAKVRSWSDSDYNYTETSYYTVYRAGSAALERIPVDGSSKMPDDLMESIEPYDFSGAVDFQTAYLAGYLADRYDVTAEQSMNRANERVKRSTEEILASTISGYSSVNAESSNVRIANSKAKYALYPVWLLNTTWNDEKFIFAMNGQTGKFVGDLPLDKGALWRWRAILTVAGTVVSTMLLKMLNIAG
jgi:DNA-directed RNA polymerase subunit RPC12/RpoP